MAQHRSRLNRRKFLKIGTLTFATPLFLKAVGLVSKATAKTAEAAQKVTAAYNKAIDNMVEGYRNAAKTMTGWGAGGGSATVSAQALINSAHTDYNPFWKIESYAAATRWGGLIAYPMYAVGGNMLQTVPWETKETGYDRQLWPGQDWEFYQPIRVGDTIRAWNREPKIIEQKAPDRGGIRGFLLYEGDYDLINQENEIVTSTQNYTVRIFYPEGPPGPPYIWDRYGFTEEEIFYLDGLARSEKVRGAEIRYYEDVKVGDTLDPVVIGPTNMNDIGAQGSGGMPAGAGPGELMEAMAQGSRDKKPKILHKLLDKEGEIAREEYIKGITGQYYKSGGGGMRHWDDIVSQAEGEPGAFLWGNMSIRCMLSCLTNWMGDDAFVRKYSWRHVTRTLVGDASYARGKVTKKRKEKGEYLVDVFIWQEDIRGFIVDAAIATVALVSKTQPYPDVKKVVEY